MKTKQSLIASAVSAVVAFDTSTVKYNDARELMGKSMCAILPLDIDRDEFVAVRDAWKKEYNGASDNANDQAWSRAIGAMNGYLISIKAEIFTVPKATSDKATAEAKRRDEKAAKAEALVTATRTEKDRKALADRAFQGDPVAETAMKLINKKARELAQHANKARLSAIRAELKNADSATLGKIAALLGIK